ncbi:MAG: hypothetical protein QGD94_03965 [Planctomycetia bacterium]|nr:hypothetical protein [Planctomycetia bacterium]
MGERGGHAWVGYIQVRGKSVDWNVRVGRFSYDHYYQGSLTDYTSGEQISDGELMMTAALFKSASASKRNIAAAYRDAAQWVYVNLMEGEEPGEDMSDWGIFAEDKNDRPEVDPKHARKVFSLAMESIKLSPYDKETWLFLGNLGKGGYLTTKQMDSSFALIRQLTLKRFPDFSFTIFKLLSSGISDTKQLNGVYEKGLAVFKFRPDLGANVKVLQREMWEKAQENKKAAKAYLQAIMMFKTESHVVTMAFGKLDALYEKTSQKRAALQVYSKIWGTLKHPRTYNGYDMSLYKLMGDRLAELLLEGGLPKRSILVKGQMEQVERSLKW